jgi:hypothetical protein
MILEVLAICTSVVVVSSLQFAKYALEHERLHEQRMMDPTAVEDSFAERRRVLERDREEWARAFGRGSASNVEARRTSTVNLREIDRRLLDLAEEELKERQG